MLAFSLANKFDCAVNLFRSLEDPFTDVLAAVGALSAPQQTLGDALFAEAVPAYSRAATHDEIHTYDALKRINFVEIFTQNFHLVLIKAGSDVGLCILLNSFRISLFHL